MKLGYIMEKNAQVVKNVISPNYVLSSAHCFKDFEKATIQFTNGKTKTITKDDVVCHEAYVFSEKNAQHDISVIKVEVPSIVHVGLNFFKHGKKLTAVGLDRRQRYSWKSFQDRIIMLNAKEKACNEYNVLCIEIEGGFASSSHGDSGAPLIQDGRAVGILSMSHEEEGENMVFYTDIQQNEGWIRAKTERSVLIAGI
ncbi:uncharacterized protein LOC116347436 [Contarinia nasturtii]|uniref:uncharacterized protein LOC116347436 n=1 Tax=Contarinia nasturtii TaxID=265458 RepID=UPI0012D490A5|nr:uncharacterized protein LOC116347436 [Contarinia nasturtii]